ncbi:MAG: beta-glucosidase [Phyllobacteriaceae bacterium]|nr:beta-glucosidase [Phyllobacteriaceae bacterium]
MASAEALARRFPASFLFGTATASYQIEGASREGGRGPSIWDTFSATPGKVKNGDTGAVACDHYHRLDSDLDMLQTLGVKAYRFSIAWPRIQPGGIGKPLAEGLAFYDRMIDGLLARGIQPFATFYHWDLPQALEDKGGWRNRDTAKAFADYAEILTQKFGDRLAAICTLNEPWCITYLSHLHGIHAPGLTDLAAAMRTVHHVNLAHGLAMQAIRSVNSSVPAGLVLNPQSIYPAEANDRSEEAAERAFLFNNGAFYGPVYAGAYPQELVDELGHLLPENWQADLGDIHQPGDFTGVNYYTPEYIHDAPKQPWPRARGERRADLPKTDLGWDIVPEAFTHCITELKQRYTLPPIYITENGACDNTGVRNGPKGNHVPDHLRLSYLESHLDQIAGMVQSGIDIRGYLLWSLMDNFEWAEGYGARFGIVHVDYATQKRTIKESGKWYQALIHALG